MLIILLKSLSIVIMHFCLLSVKGINVVHYHLTIKDIAAHIIDVSLTFTPSQSVHQLTLPAWIPGSYMIRDFARNIIRISASDANGELAVLQLDKQCWQLITCLQPVTVNYQLYANDLSVRAAYIDDINAIINPACVCLEVSDKSLQQHQLTLLHSEFTAAQQWRVATGLSRNHGTAEMAFGDYNAQNYQQLIDTPVLLGHFIHADFMLDGIKHHIILTGQPLTNLARLTTDVEKICQQQRNVFGQLPTDLTEYWFLVWVTEQGYGGLEHHNSTLLLCSYDDLPLPQGEATRSEYQNLLALCSHEYFHTWWIKRLKPDVFHHYQLQQEQYTRQLWIYEGFTSYYDDLALIKARLISADDYLKTLAKTITRVNRNPSNHVQSLQDSSFNAWTKFYKQDENAVNSVVSYYAKGTLVALCLDAALRQQHSHLDLLIRQMWQQYLTTGTTEQSIFDTLQQMGFAELAQQLTTWVTEATTLPLGELLKALGLELAFRSEDTADDTGGKAGNPHPLPSLGAQYKSAQTGITLTHIYTDGAAHKAGLMAGDQLLAIAHLKITDNSLFQIMQRLPLNSWQDIHFFRKNRLLTARLYLAPSPAYVAELHIRNTELLQSWLNTEREPDIGQIMLDQVVPETN